MTKRFVDPFCPNRPIDDPSKFSGRETQVGDIVNALFQTANKNPSHLIITGDRGVGKSSLLLQTKLLATGDNRLAEKFKIDIGLGDNYKFIIAWHDAAKGQNIENLVYGLLSDLQSRLNKLLGKFKFELDLAGILKISKNEAKENSIVDLVNIFCNEIEVAHREAEKKGNHGILLFIDELDRVSVDSGVATFIKLTVEKLSREGLKNVAFICAGITGAIQQLEEDHASILRTLRDVPISRLTPDEVALILTTGFDSVGAKYDTNVLRLAHSITNGFPEPIHLLGSQMLLLDDDDYINSEDFEKAKSRLVTELRKNELSSLLKKAGYGKYQKILYAMSEYEGSFVPLSFISEKIGEAQNEYSTNISNLLSRDIITRVDKGVYCFIDPLLKEYIRNFGIMEITQAENITD